MAGFEVPTIALLLRKSRQEVKRTIKLLLQKNLGEKPIKNPVDRAILGDPVCLNKYRAKISKEIVDLVKQSLSESRDPV